MSHQFKYIVSTGYGAAAGGSSLLLATGTGALKLTDGSGLALAMSIGVGFPGLVAEIVTLGYTPGFSGAGTRRQRQMKSLIKNKRRGRCRR
jgi:hypothetical protein